MPDEAPKYRALADELRADISAGRLTVGGRMPTKATLMSDHGVALGTIDRALSILRSEGLIKSEQGAGTWILRAPEAAPDVPAELAELRGEVTEMREHVGAVEAALMDLYAKGGYRYPGHAPADGKQKAAGS